MCLPSLSSFILSLSSIFVPKIPSRRASVSSTASSSSSFSFFYCWNLPLLLLIIIVFLTTMMKSRTSALQTMARFSIKTKTPLRVVASSSSSPSPVSNQSNNNNNNTVQSVEDSIASVIDSSTSTSTTTTSPSSSNSSNTTASTAPPVVAYKYIHLFIARGSVVNFQSRTIKDAIVNAANEGCLGGGGVDGAITAAGGFQLHKDRMALPIISGSENKYPSSAVRCPTGSAVLTGPSNDYGSLMVNHVIHAVGPNYHFFDTTDFQEPDRLLKSAYQSSLDRAYEAGIQSIAFSLLSAGVFRGKRSLEDVLKIGITSIRDWATKRDDVGNVEYITLCGFTRKEVELLLKICRTELYHDDDDDDDDDDGDGMEVENENEIEEEKDTSTTTTTTMTTTTTTTTATTASTTTDAKNMGTKRSINDVLGKKPKNATDTKRQEL